MTRFRRDINALRGVAVLLVVLFHFGVPGFGGGFVGVDVFFVISGFLMTGIVLGRLEQQRFSLIEFYIARFVRIVPALACTCATLIAFGWFYLDPQAYKTLVKHAAASLGFFSNIIYWREAGYFDTASQTKWLLHTWSLSVEWQFYLIYPIVLSLWARHVGRQRAVFVRLLWGMVTASFLLSLGAVRAYPEANFFMLPMRAWEMAAGGLVFLYADRLRTGTRATALIQAAGLAAIAVAALFITERADWPGPLTLLPVAGAAFVILCRADETWFAGFGPLQWIGRCSYSIYLWHWPVLVLARYVGWPSGVLASTLGGIGLSVVLGWVSFVVVEQRAAALRETVGARAVVALAGVPAVLLAVCAAIIHGNGYDFRLSPEVRQIASGKLDIDPRRNECLINSVARLNVPNADIGCRYGSSPDVKAIVWGDSHGNAVITSVAAAAEAAGGSVRFYGTSGCPPLIGASRFGKHREEPCRAFADRVAREIAAYPPAVPLIVVARFSAYVEGKGDQDDPTILVGYNGQRPSGDLNERRRRYAQLVTSDLCGIAKTRPVYVMLPIPEMGRDVPSDLAKSVILDRHPVDVSISEDTYARRNRVASQAIERAVEQCGVTALDPTRYLCTGGRCFGSTALQPLYMDGDHLNNRGGARLEPLFRTLFAPRARAALPQRGPSDPVQTATGSADDGVADSGSQGGGSSHIRTAPVTAKRQS